MVHALVRPAEFADHEQLSDLLYSETRLHRHLDWRPPLDWLGNRFFWTLKEEGQITAALASPVEVPGVAWVRLFVYAGRWTADQAWNLLWGIAREEMRNTQRTVVAAIAMQPWFQNLLAASGFQSRQQIVMLEWQGKAPAAHEASGVRIRRMESSDLPEVEKVDASSFDPLWRNSGETLRRALAQAWLATVAEDEEGRLIGYQISTTGALRVHLARLAVHSSAQRRGIGKALLSHLFGRLAAHGIFRLTVNTQSDNEASLHLYHRMGFVRTGEAYPVYTFDLPATS